MGKDVIRDRYARLYEIPFQLARLGHSALGICLDYHGDETGEWTHETAAGELSWFSGSMGRLIFPGLIRHHREALIRLRRFEPDVLIGASDIPHAALTRRLARKLGRPYVIDLYDNFEGFGQARIPGMTALLRSAVRDASLVTTTSEPLATYVRSRYRPAGEIVAMPSTVDKAVFRPLDRAACRLKLGLPEHARLIGTAGGLYRDKGVGVLYEAWRRLAADLPDLHLVLAGPHDANFSPPRDSRVHYLGQLPHADTAALFSALDLGVIYIRDTSFGRYCFPQKAYEMLACRLPVVSARVGAMVHLFRDTPQCLYAADDLADLTARIREQLETRTVPNVAIKDWEQLVSRLEPRLRGIAALHGD